MKKLAISLVLAIIVSVVFAGCGEKNAIWLQDGQTLTVIDNTLGEGREHNIRFVHTYKNSVVNENKGYVYILPESEENPTVRYFTSVNQDSNGELLEITKVKNGDTLTADNFISSEWGSYWDKGLEFIDSNKTAHYSSVVTNTKYRYNVTKNNNITVWGSKFLTITVTSTAVNPTPITFTLEIKNFMMLPMLLGHTGDSWEISQET